MPYYEIVTETQTREHHEVKWLSGFHQALVLTESMPGEVIKIAKVTAILNGTIVRSANGTIYGDSALDCKPIELGTWKYEEDTWDVVEEYGINFRFVD